MPEDKKTVEISQEELDRLKAIETQMGGVGEEMSGLRKRATEAEAERDALKATHQPKTEDQPTKTPEQIVEEALAKRDAETAANARVSAEAKFKASHKEFHPENDAGGVKWAAFNSALARINTSSLKSEEEFTAAFNDAYALMTRTNPAPKEEEFAPYADTPSDDGGAPRQVDPNALSPKEKKLIQSIGWTEDKYLKQKKSRPTYIAQLLEHYKV